MATPFDRTVRDLKYFFDCCVFKKDRGERFKEIKVEPCHFWFITKSIDDEYAELKSKYGILTAKLRYADYIYHIFEKDFGFCEREKWCRYLIYENHLREGVKKLGKTLHAICHDPFELILFRKVGLHLLKEKIDLENVKELYFVKVTILTLRNV